MTILLPQVYSVPNPELFKLHLACWNGEQNPLDVFVQDRAAWDRWNAWRGTRDDFSRPYIFALIEFYPQAERWLFGGAYRILARRKVDRAPSYTIELLEESKPFIGRLKLSLKRPGRAKAVNFEKHYRNLVVAELLPEPYSGESFCGFENIDVPFTTLETIVKSQRPDWKAALEHAKGVYMITDISNGKRYIGSAYGNGGVWGRWECYVGTGHGFTDELTKLLDAHSIEYARKHFKFTLLESHPAKTDDNTVLVRESFWKKALQSRGFLGYNKN